MSSNASHFLDTSENALNVSTAPPKDGAASSGGTCPWIGVASTRPGTRNQSIRPGCVVTTSVPGPNRPTAWDAPSLGVDVTSSGSASASFVHQWAAGSVVPGRMNTVHLNCSAVQSLKANLGIMCSYKTVHVVKRYDKGFNRDSITHSLRWPVDTCLKEQRPNAEVYSTDTEISNTLSEDG
jgi:hypothetical protein